MARAGLRGHVALLIAAVLGLTGLAPIAAEAASTRSLIDRPDEVLGPQIHLIYVVAKDAEDRNWDTNGQIKKWVDQSQTWFTSQIGRSLRYDKFSGELDITYLKSNLTMSDMTTGANATIYTSKLIPQLIKEFLIQSPQKNYAEAPKTYIFVSSEKIEPDYCGFANSYIGGIIWSGNNCWTGTQDDSTVPYGMAWTARALIHEAIHTYGVNHVCDSNADLMWGTPECQGNIPYSAMIFDLNRDDYYGGEKSGADISKLPIWLETAPNSDYSKVKATQTYAPAVDGNYIFTVGKSDNLISWQWSRIWGYREGSYLECTISNGKSSITASVVDSRCSFALPANWRGGVTAVVTAKIIAGPYSGETQEQVRLWNPENQFKSCGTNYCFNGETIDIRSGYCYSKDNGPFTLEVFLDGQWKAIATSPARARTDCSSPSFEPIPVSYTFTNSGIFLYRWIEASTATTRGFTEPTSAISILESDADYPSAAKKIELETAAKEAIAAAAKKVEEDRRAREAEAAAKKAEEERLAREAAAAQAAAEAAAREAAKAAAQKKTTITCVKGKVTKKVTAVNPKCPAGYKKR